MTCTERPSVYFQELLHLIFFLLVRYLSNGWQLTKFQVCIRLCSFSLFFYLLFFYKSATCWSYKSAVVCWMPWVLKTCSLLNLNCMEESAACWFADCVRFSRALDFAFGRWNPPAQSFGTCRHGAAGEWYGTLSYGGD